MAKKPTARQDFVLFNVTYEDGTQRSNRKVAAEIASGYDAEAAIRAEIEAQDRAIAEKSRLPPLPIKSISKVK